MVNLKRLFKPYRESGSLSSLFNVQAAVDDHAFITKSGEVLLVLSFRGADPECLEPSTLAAFSAACQSTIHANSTSQAFTRLTNCTLEAGIELPYAAIRSNIAASIDLVVQIQRRDGKRMVSEVVEVQKYNHVDDRFETLPVGGSIQGDDPLPSAKPMRKARSRFGG